MSTVVMLQPRLFHRARFDASSFSSREVSGDMQWTHTPNGNANLVVVLVQHNQDALTSVTYGGLVMTTETGVEKANSFIECTLLSLYNPPSGAQSVVVARSGINSVIAGAITVMNAATSSAVRVTAGGTATSAAVNVAIHPAYGDLVVGGVVAVKSSGTATFTDINPQVMQWNTSVVFGSPPPIQFGRASTLDGVGESVTFGYTITTSVSWAALAAAVKPPD